MQVYLCYSISVSGLSLSMKGLLSVIHIPRLKLMEVWSAQATGTLPLHSSMLGGNTVLASLPKEGCFAGISLSMIDVRFGLMYGIILPLWPQSIRLRNYFNCSLKLSEYLLHCTPMHKQSYYPICNKNREHSIYKIEQKQSHDYNIIKIEVKNKKKDKMKNIELYRTIEELIETKKQQYTPTQPSFAHQYCKKQIERKKLVPYNPRSKMSKIMKNFDSLETYVNVEQLFQYIDLKNQEKKKHQEKAMPDLKWKSKQKISFDEQEVAITNMREKLGPYNQRIYTKENVQMCDLIEYLEKESQTATFKRRNSPHNDYLNFFEKNTKAQEGKNKYESEKKQKWRFYDGQYIIEDSNTNSRKNVSQPQLLNATNWKQKLKDRQKKMQLIHQVTTYLQIILENHHKKKWGYKKLKLSQRNTQHSAHEDCKSQIKLQVKQEAKNENKSDIKNDVKFPSKKELKIIKSKLGVGQKQQAEQKENFGQKQLKSTLKQTKSFRNATRHTDHRSLGERSLFNTTKSSLESSILSPNKKSMYSFNSSLANSKNVDFCKFLKASKKVHVNQNFTFRNRNIKQNLLKKVNDFLELVENEQKQFQKQKNSSIDLLDYYEKKQIIDNQMGCINFFVDDHELKAVQNIVQMQK